MAADPASLWFGIPPRVWLVMLLVGWVGNAWLWLNPGYFHTDEIGLLAKLATGELNYAPWTWGGDAIFWRPLAFNAELQLLDLFGEWPQVIHSADVAVHLTSAVLVAKLSWLVFRSSRAVLVAFLAFALSPLAAVGAGWVQGTFDRWATLFVLFACASYIDPALGAMRRTLQVALGFVLALASKESGLVLLLYLTIASVGGVRSVVGGDRGQKQNPHAGRLVALLACCVLAVLYLSWRWLGLVEQPVGESVYAPNFGVNVLHNIAAYFAYPAAFLARGVGGMVDEGSRWLLWFGGGIHVAMLAWLLCSARSRSLAVVAYLALFFGSIGPALFFVNKFEGHYMYLSGVPLALLLGFLSTVCSRSGLTRGLFAAVMAIGLVHTGVSHWRIHRDGEIQQRLYGTLEPILRDLATDEVVPYAFRIEPHPEVPRWLIVKLTHEVRSWAGLRFGGITTEAGAGVDREATIPLSIDRTGAVSR